MSKYIASLLAILALTLAGCGGNTAATQGDGTGAAQGAASTTAATTVLKVGATPVPHAEILQFVKDNLATKEGLAIEIIEFNDYVQPNLALNDKQIDANFFQHVPYMTDFGKEKGIDMVAVANVHIEPLGVYSRKVKALADVPSDAVVAIPNDATNGGRALQLLATQGLITLKEGVGTAATIRDIVDNRKQIQIEELDAAQLPRCLDDTPLSIINTNYALVADLQPKQDALALEPRQNNPYANVLAVLKGREADPAIQKLAKLLTSPEVKQFIEDKYQGAVVPAF